MGFFIPIVQLRHKSALIYYQYQTFKAPDKNGLRMLNMQIQRQKQYNGTMSQGAKKRLTKAITLLCQTAKKRWIYNEVSKRMVYHQLSFITLTVSDPEQKLSGKDAYKKLLSHFIAWLRRTKKVNTYIWKAELQKNGQIHYHITTPAFIPYHEIRDKWNNLQKKAGLLDKYHEDKGHYNANSTDIHSVKNINDLSGYLIKYIAKQTQNEQALGGKVWDCSDNLSKAKYHSLPMTDRHKQFFDLAIENELATAYHDERFSIIKFQEPPEEYLLTKEEFQQYKAHLRLISNTIRYEDPPGLKELESSA